MSSHARKEQTSIVTTLKELSKAYADAQIYEEELDIHIADAVAAHRLPADTVFWRSVFDACHLQTGLRALEDYANNQEINISPRHAAPYNPRACS